ncbi:hypothetical protein GGR56DRAFT_102546 [Xylariaceae sp. FL0804]|nr:hypothetical protein GGR56DRAFT_102546 [Xylariaceae sp. FL0804]
MLSLLWICLPCWFITGDACCVVLLSPAVGCSAGLGRVPYFVFSGTRLRLDKSKIYYVKSSACIMLISLRQGLSGSRRHVRKKRGFDSNTTYRFIHHWYMISNSSVKSSEDPVPGLRDQHRDLTQRLLVRRNPRSTPGD